MACLMNASRANIPAAECLIVALDFDNARDALGLVDKLDGAVHFFKVGYELFIGEGHEVIAALHERGHRTFLDIKMNDVNETVRRAVRNLARRDTGIDFMTIYGEAVTARSAKEGKGDSALKILQVTLLTSLGLDDLQELGIVGEGRRFATVEDYVVWRAQQSLEAGCDGLISSGQNARMLREHCGDDFILVCPGIRPKGVGTDEHKRACTPHEAIVDGADYLVVGRPIRDAGNPADAARAIIDEIRQGLDDRG